MKALWCCRHPPVKAQVDELLRRGIELVVVNKDFYATAEEVIEIAKAHNCKYIIPVLPLSMVDKVCELAEKNGITVLYAVMEKRDISGVTEIDPNVDVIVPKSNGKEQYVVARFRGFKKLKGVRLELEDW